MPSPRSGRAGNAVSPTEPKKPEEADKADPGEMAKIKSQQQAAGTGKYGAAKFKPFTPSAAEEEEAEEGEEEAEEKTWIEIELVDENDEPVPGEKYRITLPDGRVAEGTLDTNGSARVSGIDPGTCQITFPDLDKEAWERL
jgi:hypothetical protein